MDPEAEKDRHRPENWIVRYVLGVADHLRASDKNRPLFRNCLDRMKAEGE